MSNDFDFANEPTRNPRKRKSGCRVWFVLLTVGLFSWMGLCCTGAIIQLNKTPEEREAERKKAEEEQGKKRELTGKELETAAREFEDITYMSDKANQAKRLDEWKERYPQLASKLNEKKFWQEADKNRAENAALEEFVEITGIKNVAERNRRVDDWTRRNPMLVKRMQDRINAIK